LVLGAFGLLIAALTTANTLWAWVSVVVSVVAAALLVSDWVNGRRRSRGADEPDRPRIAMADGVRQDAPADDLSDYEDDLLEDDDVFPREAFPSSDAFQQDAFPPEPEPRADLDFGEPVAATGPDAVRTVVTEAVEPPTELVEAPADLVDDRADGRAAHRAGGAGHRADDSVDYDDAEPGEEPTDASDLLVVAGLNAEVRVVDEHPRYHLATCVWLANRPTIPIPVSEARQLGFTPCARCGPDSTLAARHRARAN
jgi:hypothetical protein